MTPDASTVTMWSIVGLPLAEAIVVGLLGGLVGCLAVLDRRVFFTESVTHATFPGAVLGVVAAVQLGAGFGAESRHAILSAALFIGAGVMCLPMAWLMHGLARVPGQSSQAAAGIVLTFGFALGYFLIKWFQPLPLQIEGFLTGSILHVGPVDVAAAAIVLAVAVAAVAVAGRRIVFHAFDDPGFRAAGLSGGAAEGVILVLIVAAIVVLIPAVGTILPVALVAAPAAALAPSLRSWRTLLVAAPLSGAAVSVAGLLLAVAFDLSAGGMIALCAGALYVVAALVRRAAPRRRARAAGRAAAAVPGDAGSAATLAE